MLIVFILLIGLCNPSFLVEASEKTNQPSSHQDMVFISPGSFLMGAENNQGYQSCVAYNETCKEKWFNDEAPVHRVKLDGFHIDIYEVTQKDFKRVMEKNPSEFKGSSRPVENVTWFDAKEYCRQLGKRLPTEAEWERAARGESNSVFPWGDKAGSEKANFCDAQCDKGWKVDQFNDGYSNTAPVGSFPPNSYGLFDMAGNVYEWVSDWHDEDYYRISPKENPRGPKSGKKKVMRGGSWINYATGVRPADRTDSKPNARMDFVGFRCAR
ncbi:MAG: formylglycine-generating enzyme family protein [Nitrospina sp.]|jgi:formylglycine-generating enzyme|nr:formylglycine-generating enzyme family protein [Nitrospina sp.]MBT4557597.1 formylglycine-generating enzyme family protein [Nitrospina sp.]MBT5349948.1 formylglycine-generating enzyme family protein [Nitrospina sp.]MBT5652325.1 formylglycine-generating enzyme family protein [Nitrospina sp.]MBT6248965.1 formylglycine-generating enzyme family protein [Nitrospina sp.]